ncbi:MAG: HTH domain-containing protein, partial [Anaeromyxobacteraceae bacterium]
MTFTEAAIEVLRREGKPLHFTKIAEIASREDLLDHVGKIPEETMAGQLVAHCRLPKADRRVIAVQHGTFALVEWGLDEDPAGTENLVEPPPVDEVPYRSNERHPIPSREVVRASGRGEGRGEPRGRRREEGEERRPKRFPPPSEVAYEILAGSDRALTLVEIATQGSERLLMPEAFVRDLGSLRAALLEDNRRRESAGRKQLFALAGETVTLVAQPEPGDRAAAAPLRAPVSSVDLRQAALGALRSRMRDCDGPTFEHLAAALLERMGYQELKVVKRGREHAIYTARKQLGAANLRHAIRVLRAHEDVTRRDVQDLRRDVSNYGAQIGVVIGTGDAQREARGEAGAGGQLPVILLCGEALSEAATEAGVGCRQVIVPEVDESFFRDAAEKGAEEEAARRARREERDRREGREGREG